MSKSIKETSLSYRRTAHGIRVWRDDWQCDMFEVLTEDEFEEVKRFCGRFSVPLVEHQDD